MRAYNFSPGPAAIPEAVLTRVKEELLDWRGLGMSAIEISHRGKDFLEHVLHPAKENLRRLLNIPKNYHILFISGGATTQFSMVPLNLLGKNNTADYFFTGLWSGKAIREAERYGKINIAVDNSHNKHTDIPVIKDWQLNPHASYVHYASNETVHGVQFHDVPDVGNVPLVADMSSDILSKPIDVSKFGLIYAAGQKNIGPSGLTIVIMRDDLLREAKAFTPMLYNYQPYVDQDSVCNTPNTFGIYLSNLVFEWLLEEGGVEKMAVVNQRKANKLYAYLDSTNFYRHPVEKSCRSVMNVVFYLPTPELDQLFVQKATAVGLANLKGHKVTGGIRASIYNAMPEAGVDALIAFMKEFEKHHG